MVMKRNAMRKNLLQSIRKSFGRYIAIVAIIALGSSMFVGLLMTKTDMVATGQRYADQLNMFDLRLMSAYGWDLDQVSEIEQLGFAESVEPLIYQDLVVTIGESTDESVYRFLAIPDTINRIYLEGGRMPEAKNECLIDGYYLDDSIFVITWQEVYKKYVYTFSEVKINHPSQFRRYLAGNEYDSDYSHSVSRMGNMTNAVIASSADFYRGRNHGIIVYQGKVMRTNYSELVDTCFIDRDGNLILVPAGEINGIDEAQKFVDENNIDFSLAFGPILVKDGVRCDPDMYYLGEINDNYPRAALCQKDDLHYMLVVCNRNFGYFNPPTIHTFAERIEQLNCKLAYTLDGGKTGTISMRGKALNPLNDSERWISDIIYFATAIPAPETTPEPTTP